MESKKTIWTIVIIVILVVLGIYLLSLSNSSREKGVSPTSTEQVGSVTSTNSSANPEPTPAAPDFSVPEENDVTTSSSTPVE